MALKYVNSIEVTIDGITSHPAYIEIDGVVYSTYCLDCGGHEPPKVPTICNCLLDLLGPCELCSKD